MSVLSVSIPALTNAVSFGAQFGIIGVVMNIISLHKWILCGGDNCAGIHTLIITILGFVGASLVAMLPLGGLVATGIFGAGASLALIQSITGTLINVAVAKLGGKFCAWRSARMEEQQKSRMCLSCALSEVDDSDIVSSAASGKKAITDGSAPGISSRDFDLVEKNE